jgi:hypothetical protein
VGLDANAETAIEHAVVWCGGRADRYLKLEELLVNDPAKGSDGEKMAVALDPWNCRDGGILDIRRVRTALPEASILVYTTGAEKLLEKARIMQSR